MAIFAASGNTGVLRQSMIEREGFRTQAMRLGMPEITAEDAKAQIRAAVLVAI